MPVRVNAAQATDKWVSRLSAATNEIQQGVARVTVAPGHKAAAKKQRWIQAIHESQDKWARNVAAVPLDEWKQMMTQVGIPRIAQGAQQKKAKTQRFFDQFLPFLEGNVRRVEAMPDTTIDQRIQKAVEMMRLNHGFKRSAGPGGGGG